PSRCQGREVPVRDRLRHDPGPELLVAELPAGAPLVRASRPAGAMTRSFLPGEELRPAVLPSAAWRGTAPDTGGAAAAGAGAGRLCPARVPSIERNPAAAPQIGTSGVVRAVSVAGCNGSAGVTRLLGRPEVVAWISTMC